MFEDKGLRQENRPLVFCSSLDFELFCLKFIKQLTDSEIANIKNVSRQDISKSIIKIKNKLRKYYKM